MFETWYGNYSYLGATDRKEALRAAKQAAKAAGLPFDQEAWVRQYDAANQGIAISPVSTPMTTLPAPAGATGGAYQAPVNTQPATNSPGIMDSLSSAFGSINPTYLMLGGAVALFMILKKR